jgi:hypothetical protein
VRAYPLPRPWGLVEVAPDAAGQLRDGPIRAAYLLSSQGLVALVLNGVSRAQAGAVLDPVVAAFPTLRGVLYMEVSDEERVLAAAAHATVVVASTDAFLRRLSEAGIRATRYEESPALMRAAACAALPRAATPRFIRPERPRFTPAQRLR